MGTAELQLLLNLGYIVVAAAVFAFLGKLIRMPSIVSYVLAGIVLGPVLHLVEISDSLEVISELGVALLLFLVGLELSLGKIRDLGRVALLLGFLQVALTSGLGFLVSAWLGFGLIESLFLAATATFSSTVVVIKLLDQKGEMHRLYARIAVGLFLVQDIFVIIALTILSGLEGKETVEMAVVFKSLLLAFGGMAVLLFTVLVASRYALPRPFAWAARSSETVFIWALCWCFLVVMLAHQFHLSVEIGAFLAGIALAQLPFHADLHRRLHPLMTFFIAVFLVTLGVKMEFGDFLLVWPSAIALTAFVLLLKPVLVFGILSRLRFSRYTAFQTAVATGQVSEFAFILLAMGAATGLVSGIVVALGGMVGIMTIAISSYLILYSEGLFRLAQKTGLLGVFGAKEEPDPEPAGRRKGHVIVIGMNALGREIVQRLSERGEHVLALDTDPKKLDGLEPAETMIGNVEYESVVREIRLNRAKLVVSALQIEDTNHMLTYRCRSAEVPCAIHAFDVSVVNDLLELGTDFLLTPSIDGAVEQRQILQRERILEA